MSDVVFSVFDLSYGPMPVFSTLDELTSKKIALKSQMTLSMMQGNINVSDAVLPFPDIEKIAYVYLFMIDADGRMEKIVASLSYLVTLDKQMQLYKQIAVLKYQAEVISKSIQDNYTYVPNNKLPNSIHTSMKEWASSTISAEMTIEEEYTKRRITIRRSEVQASIPFLFSQIKKREDFEKLVEALTFGRPIFIVSSNKTLFDLAVSTLELFTPYKSLRKISNTTTPISPDEADLIGIPSNLVNVYKGEVILDLDKGRVMNGNRSPFVARLLRDIKGKPDKDAEHIIKDRVLWVLDQASRLIEAFGMVEEGAERDKIVKEVKKKGAEAITLIVEIAVSANPLIAEVVRKEVGLKKKYTEWMMGL